MKAYYEPLRDNQNNVHFVKNKNYIFNPHFHSAIEILIVKKGVCPVNVNGKDYTITDGQIAFFDSFEFHGYSDNATDNCQTMVIILPPVFVEKFTIQKQGKHVKNFIISDFELCDTIMDIIEKFVNKNNNQQIVSASVDLILSLIYPRLEYVEEDKNSSFNLLKEILSYLNNNFKQDINLDSISKTFGYSNAHISRLFNGVVKRTIRQYVNDLRVEYVKKRLNDIPKPSVTELIYESGFNSIQTYYRALEKYTNQNN